MGNEGAVLQRQSAVVVSRQYLIVNYDDKNDCVYTRSEGEKVDSIVGGVKREGEEEGGGGGDGRTATTISRNGLTWRNQHHCEAGS